MAVREGSRERGGGGGGVDGGVRVVVLVVAAVGEVGRGVVVVRRWHGLSDTRLPSTEGYGHGGGGGRGIRGDIRGSRGGGGGRGGRLGWQLSSRWMMGDVRGALRVRCPTKGLFLSRRAEMVVMVSSVAGERGRRGGEVGGRRAGSGGQGGL